MIPTPTPLGEITERESRVRKAFFRTLLVACNVENDIGVSYRNEAGRPPSPGQGAKHYP